MNLCTKNHLMGNVATCWCGSERDAELGGRVTPLTLHPKTKGLKALRKLRADHRQGSCVYGNIAMPPTNTHTPTSRFDLGGFSRMLGLK